MNTTPEVPRELSPLQKLFYLGVPIFIVTGIAISFLRPQKVQSSFPAPELAVAAPIKAAEKPAEPVSASNFLADVKLLTNAMNKTWGGASALQEEFTATANMIIMTSQKDAGGASGRFCKVFTIGNSVCTVVVSVNGKTGRPQSLTFQDRQIRRVPDSANFDISYDLEVGDKSVSGKYLPIPAEFLGGEELKVPDPGSIDKVLWLKLLAKCMADCRYVHGW